MNLYELSVQKDLTMWYSELTKRPSIVKKASNKLQKKLHSYMPDKIQDGITIAVKSMIETIIFASSCLTKAATAHNPSLSESDYLVEKMYKSYYKMALVQGVGFGLGGVLINLADLPALLSIKVKFLFDCSKLYGFDIEKEEERIFMLYVFNLAFSNEEQRCKILPKIIHWDQIDLPVEIDWLGIQKGYRDALDIAKLLQNLPLVGAVAGGVANHQLMEKLKETAMNCYRLRVLNASNHRLLDFYR